MERLEVKVEEDSVPQPIVGLRDGGPPPFLTKTYDMVEDSGTDSVVSWSVGRNSFIVWDSLKFATTILPKYFKHDNFSSFIRQLNTYGFRKVDPDRWEFANEGFLGGQKHLLKHIKRKQNVSQKQQQKAGVCVELGQFGFETELEMLRRDRKMLMTEIFKIRQLQQKSRAQLMAMEERLQGTETKQRQVMAFMARAFSNPTFMQQLVSQREMKQRLGSVGKKRRLPVAPESTQAEEEEEMMVDSEMNVLLATADDNFSTSTIEVNQGVNVEPVNDAIWEDLLGEDMLIGNVAAEDASERDVLQESIAAKLDDLDEYMNGLLEQMECNSP